MNADLRERVAKAMWESRKYRGTWEAGTTETERADYLHMAAAALSVAQGQGWLPIESCPNSVPAWVHYAVGKKGSKVEFITAYDNDYDWTADSGRRETWLEVATHWHPVIVPAAPAQPDGVE